MSKDIQIKITPKDPHIRIDSFLSAKSLGISRNYIQNLIEQGNITINGKRIKSSHKISAGEMIQIILPEPEPLNAEAEDIPLDIIYEDDHVIVVNKPAGMVVHPATGIKHGTLVNALLYHCKNLSGIGGVQRPGIVHRIDKGTSGLLMVAKTDLAHQSLSLQLKQRIITRTYLALVYGNVKQNDGYIETQIGRNPVHRKKMAVLKAGGRVAGTHYKVLGRFSSYSKNRQTMYYSFSLLECKLTTGRTHQIRVHLSHLGYPVVGDSTYGKGKTVGLGKDIKTFIAGLNGFALHAQVLGFHHPANNQFLEFSVNPPKTFQNIIDYLNKP